MSENQYYKLMTALADGIERSAPELARAQKTMFDALVDEGFTEEQALEILKGGVEANA